MRRFSFVLGFALCVAPVLAASQDFTIWSCRDRDGRTHVTNLKEDTVGMDCRIVQQTRVQVVPAQKSSTKSGAGAPPTAFPKEDSDARASARERQREILEKELKQEESQLDGARKELEAQDSVRGGDERNYARVLERLQKYKDAVDLHEKNVESLKRELANLYL
ncbi:MAG: DUF4124 domain-containing protein, partial [Burkholderiales bacterium]